MFRRRDIPPVLLLVFLIILVMLTLSQILVVHNGRYGRNIHSVRRLQMELKEMDVNLQSMMLQNVPSIELNRRLLQNEVNARRVAEIIREASIPDPRFLPSTSTGSDRFRNRTAIGLPRRWPSSGSSAWPLSAAVANALIRNSPSDVDYGARSNDTDNSWRTKNSSISGFHRGSYNSDDAVTWPSRKDDSQLMTLSKVNPTSTFSGGNPLSGNNGGPRTATAEPEDLGFTKFQSKDGSSKQRSLTNIIGEAVTSEAPKNWSMIGSNMTSRLSYCPPVPPGLRGRIFVNLQHKHDYTEEEVVGQNPGLLPGGASRPGACTARHKIAVVVPYRDRQTHLIQLLSHLHPMLQRQQLDYRIYVVEQQGEYTFNKARIMNIAFIEALKQYPFQCFVFHDVDLVPEDDRNMYSCPVQPRHMSVAIDEMGYKLAYQELVGGVLNMRTEHFQRVNGYSNLYWGWGAEDDDMAYRIMHVGLKITRPPDSIARYKMIKHTKRKPSDWRKRTKLLYTGTRRFQFDGLNSLQYRLVRITNTALYTHILVDIGRPPRGF